MAIFHSNIKALSLTMKIDGHIRYFHFTAKDAPFTYGYLYVYNPREVAALKKHPKYGQVFWIDQEDEVIEVVETPKVQLKEYPDIRKTQDAKEILKNEYNYPTENIRSKVQALEAAKELNISFPNLQ